MQFAYKIINIQSPTPTTQFGHLSQTYLVNDYHDPLNCRIAGFKDGDNWIIHFSLDLLCFRLEQRNKLQNKIREYFHNNNIHIITSTTHTHSGNNPTDPTYKPWLLETLFQGAISLEYQQYENVKTSYQHVFCQTVGKSRISGYEENNEYLSLISFYSNQTNFFNLIIYNVHPTILSASVPYFSSEYPGYVVTKLTDKYKVPFSFCLSASGDISSRFTRDGQDYDALVKLADKLCIDIEKLLATSKDNLVDFKLDYKQQRIDYKHDCSPIDLSKMNLNISERELETIKMGQIIRQRYLDNPSTNEDGLFTSLIEYVIVSALDLGSVKIIFYPNEIFSKYLNEIDLDKKMLVSYSNGFGPYILPIDFPYVTYEMFTDTLTKECKKEIMHIIKTI